MLTKLMLNVTALNLHTAIIVKPLKALISPCFVCDFILRKNLRNRKIRLSRKNLFISFSGRNASNFERPLSKSSTTTEMSGWTQFHSNFSNSSPHSIRRVEAQDILSIFI